MWQKLCLFTPHWCQASENLGKSPLPSPNPSILRGHFFSTPFTYLLKLPENAHLPFDKPFDRLTVLSRVEGLMALSLGMREKVSAPRGRWCTFQELGKSVKKSDIP